MTTNGAVLLRRGRIDEAWRRKQAARITPCWKELLAQYETQSKKEEYIRCRLVDESYLFAYCADGVSVEETAEKCRRETLLTVQHSGRKIYFFPPGLDKGLAVKMLREKNLCRRRQLHRRAPASGSRSGLCPQGAGKRGFG